MQSIQSVSQCSRNDCTALHFAVLGSGSHAGGSGTHGRCLCRLALIIASNLEHLCSLMCLLETHIIAPLCCCHCPSSFTHILHRSLDSVAVIRSLPYLTNLGYQLIVLKICSAILFVKLTLQQNKNWNVQINYHNQTVLVKQGSSF